MADMAINLNATQNAIDNIKEGWNNILELVSKITAAQDNLLKSVNTTNDALKGMQNNLSQETGIASVISEETSGASGSLVKRLAASLDTLKTMRQELNLTDAQLKDVTFLPENLLQQLETFNSLAGQSSAAGSFAEFHSQLASGTITLDEYIAKLTRTVKELEEGEAAAEKFFGGISNKANEVQESLKAFAADSLTGLVGTFKSTLLAGGDIGAALSAKLKDIGINLLDTILESLLNDSINALFNGTTEFFGGGITGFLNNAFSILSKLFSNILGIFLNAQGNVFGPQGVMPFAHGGIISQPTLFGFSKGIGLMGEAGAEAIMPLGRDSRGNLGVRVADSAMSGSGTGGVFAPHVEINVENKGGGDMSEEQARTLGTQVKAIVEMQVAKQMYEYMRNGTLRPSMGRGY